VLAGWQIALDALAAAIASLVLLRWGFRAINTGKALAVAAVVPVTVLGGARGRPSEHGETASGGSSRPVGTHHRAADLIWKDMSRVAQGVVEVRFWRR
jgi:hypothetical protein